MRKERTKQSLKQKWIEKVTKRHLYIIIIDTVGLLIIVNQMIAQYSLKRIESKEYATYITGQLAIES
ncbi:hypothetical protein AB2B38_003195 [Balneola sp. MJW-20]|uniref:hypothetical protein n=1 Tax=Gracilimonas aurantiaca TaxID=3234185 RepID=UPI0034675247